MPLPSMWQSTPQTGDQLNANYRYADPSNPLSSLAATQVVCSGVGSTTSSAAITTPENISVISPRLIIRSTSVPLET